MSPARSHAPALFVQLLLLFFALLSLQVGLLQDESLPGYKEASRLMREFNPNPVMSSKQGMDFFEDLTGTPYEISINK